MLNGGRAGPGFNRCVNTGVRLSNSPPFARGRKGAARAPKSARSAPVGPDLCAYLCGIADGPRARSPAGAGADAAGGGGGGPWSTPLL